MPELKDLRALIADYQEKDTLGEWETPLCLAPDLVKLHEELTDERDDLLDAEPVVEHGRLSGPVAADESEALAALNKRIADVEDDARSKTVTLVFRALSEKPYQDLQGKFPDREDDEAEMRGWLESLTTESFRHATLEGATMKIDLAELRPLMNFGKWSEVVSAVFNLNTRVVDVPFSLKPSKRVR
jgi:hypothetical protein